MCSSFSNIAFGTKLYFSFLSTVCETHLCFRFLNTVWRRFCSSFVSTVFDKKLGFCVLKNGFCDKDTFTFLKNCLWDKVNHNFFIMVYGAVYLSKISVENNCFSFVNAIGERKLKFSFTKKSWWDKVIFKFSEAKFLRQNYVSFFLSIVPATKPCFFFYKYTLQDNFIHHFSQAQFMVKVMFPSRVMVIKM